MIHVAEPDAERMKRTLWRQPVDRVPNYEVLICQRNARYLLGREDAPASWWMEPADHVQLMKKIGQDVMVVPVVDWTLQSEEPHIGRAHEGALVDRAALRRAHLYTHPEHIQPAVDRIHRHLEAAADTRIGICAGLGALIFDRSLYALGFENFMTKILDERSFVEEVLEIYTQYCVDLVRAISKFPITMIHAGDDVAHKTGLFVHPQLFRELWFNRMKRIVAPALERGIPFLFHSDGCLRDILPLLPQLGITGVNPIEPYSNDIYEIKALYGDRLVLIGNIDISLLAFGSTDEVRSHVREHIKRLMPGGGYILSSSHSITDDVQPENFLAMLHAGWEYGLYK